MTCKGSVVQVHLSSPHRNKFRLFRFFYCIKNQSPASLFLLFRKKARSRRLFACKRAHFAFGSPTTFLRDFLHLTHIFVFLLSEQSSLCSVFLCQEKHPPAFLLLLVRKKAHLRRLFPCKRAHNAFGSLSPFCEERTCGTWCICFVPFLFSLFFPLEFH